MKTNESGTPGIEFDEASFQAEVLESTQPVLVAFLSPWSRPCQVMDSVLQKLAKELKQRAKVVKINADESLDLSVCYDIQSVPTLICFVEGRPCLRIVGTASKEAILSRLKPFANTTATQAKSLTARAG